MDFIRSGLDLERVVWWLLFKDNNGQVKKPVTSEGKEFWRY